MGVEGLVVAVTGVATGIGRATARGLASQGASVVGMDIDAERGESVASGLRADGHAMTFVAGDVRDPADGARFIETVLGAHGRIDALVNNVGGPGARSYASTLDVGPDEFDDLLALNVRSAFFCSQAAIRAMQRQGGGAIVNVSSVVGNQAMARQVVYAISKAAVDHLTRCLAVEFIDDDIRVNSVVIGGAPTRQVAQAFAQVSEAFGVAPPQIERIPPILGATSLDEIVDAIVFLCSPASRGVTAAAVTVDRARSAGAVFSAALLDALAGRWTVDSDRPPHP
jgi:NAD(P)-dependent dehydrogenase (short-subunit alcohol dehydrogenase family)